MIITTEYDICTLSDIAGYRRCKIVNTELRGIIVINFFIPV